MNNWTLPSFCRSALVLGMVFVCCANAIPLQAQEGASHWVRGDAASVRLVSAETGTSGRDTVHLGLEFMLDPGWKTYWRSPGDAGLPLQLQWVEQKNLSVATFRWPAPTRFTVLGTESFGYADHVIFPIDVQLKRPGNPLAVVLQIEYIVCNKICIPESANLELNLLGGPADLSEFSSVIDSFRARVPSDGVAAGLGFDGAVLIGSKVSPTLVVAFSAVKPFVKPDLFIEGPQGVVFGPPSFSFDSTRGRIQVRAQALNINFVGTPKDIAGSEITLTLLDGERAMERVVAPQFGILDPFPPPEPIGTNLLTILVVAVLGGLILNFMPCVLPVLSLKLLRLVEASGTNPGQVRLSFLATSAGILISFLFLGGGAAVGKAAGMAVGWGVQFQQPVFLVAMMFILILFACNLWELFDISLPRYFADYLPVWTRTGGRSVLNDFVTGAFITLLATPCSAPFLGTAVGFALSRSTPEIFAIFAALGLGLAIPYLLVSAVPTLARFFPRPGQWMITLKRVLSLPLVLTVLWLLSVFSRQISMVAALMMASILLVLVVPFIVRRFWPSLGRYATVSIAMLGLAGFAVPAVMPVSVIEPAVSVRTSSVVWQPLDNTLIAAMVSGGKTVFVDVTADWCLTCQMNKAFALSDKSVGQLLNSSKVVAMRGDWTRPDASISAYLASFGRYGIPFNVIYGPDRPNGVVLPEVLTVGSIFGAAKEADSSSTLVVN